MRTLQIDFAPRGVKRMLYSARPLTAAMALAGLLLCVCGLLTMAWLGQPATDGGAAETPMVVAKPLPTDGPKVAAQKVSVSAEQAEAINATIRRLNLPWSALLDAMEKATPASVALISLEPDAKRNVVKGVAETRTPEQMASYIGRLKQQPFFGHVVLTHHEAASDEVRPNAKGGEPIKPLRFEFEVQWREAAP